MAQVSKINMGGIDYDIRDKVLEKEVGAKIASFEATITNQVNNYKPIQINGDVTNAADEVDITSQNNLLKLKDRNNLNGMGYVILRNDATFASQVTKENTIYEVRTNFDLAKANITMPKGCVFFFNGGNLSNGTISGDVDVCGKHTSQKTFVNGYNLSEHIVVASNIGMVANDETAASHNAAILAKCVALNKELSLYDSYYFNATKLEVKGAFSIVGNGKLIVPNTERFFILKEASSLELNGVEIDANSSCILISVENASYQMKELVIRNCKYNGGRFVDCSFADVDYATTKIGFKRFIFENNDITSTKSLVILNDAVVSDECQICRNYLHNLVYEGFHIAVTNEHTYSDGNRVYWCDVYVDENIADGGITETDSYNTLLLAEVNTVFYRRNVVRNLLNVGNGVSYDGYISSWRYISENNFFENIATIPKNGVKKPTPDEFAKSKSDGTLRCVRNNIWKNDYNAIKEMLSSYLGDMSDETYKNLCEVAILRYTGHEDFVLFENNTMEIIGGILQGSLSAIDIERLDIINNKFYCDLTTLITMKKGDIVIKDNLFMGSKGREAILLVNNNSKEDKIGSLLVERNYFNTSWRTGEQYTGFKKVIIKNNTMLGLAELAANYSPALPFGEEYTDAEYVWYNNTPNKGIVVRKGKVYCSTSENKEVNKRIYTEATQAKFTITLPTKEKLCYIMKVENNVTNIYDANGNLICSPTGNYGDVLYYDAYIKIYGSTAANQNGYIWLNANFYTNETIIIEVDNEDVGFNEVKSMGESSNRPKADRINVGYQYFDKTLKKPIWWNGESWIDSTGASV